MIELPEAATIARQMTKELRGKRIASATRGNAPHKFAFYSGSAKKYSTLLRGKTMGEPSISVRGRREPFTELFEGCSERP